MDKKYSDIELGMTTDELLKLHPESEFIAKPSVYIDTKIQRYIVLYHYDGIDVRNEWAESDDLVMKLACYGVQSIVEVKNE